MTLNPVEAAVNAAGSQGKLARMCNVKQQAVFYWVHKTKVIPAQHVLTLEKELGISRHDLNPDIYPSDEVA